MVSGKGAIGFAPLYGYVDPRNGTVLESIESSSQEEIWEWSLGLGLLTAG